jgi:hypothetical protein
MKFNSKDLDAGFIILCDEGNIGSLKHTIKSLNFRYTNQPYIGVVGKGTSSDNIKEMKELCPIYRGKETITSLINTGLRNTQSDWNLIIFSGSWLHGRELTKFSYFVEKETDILFPIINNITNFVDGCMNGILIHRKTFKLIGPIGEDNPLNICKLLWAMEAQKKGCRLVGVLGPKII